MGLFKLTKQDKDYQALQDMLSPKEDQGEETTTTGILSKPDTKKEEDEESTFLSFFGNVFDRSKSQAEEISRMMQEEAERSALEVRLSRQTAGITRSLPTEIANKRYNESALSGPMKLAPRALEEPVPVDVEELETPKESIDNERQSAINRMLDNLFTSDSDTTVVTDDADGGAAPSGKGLMSPRLDSKGETPEEPRIGDVNFSPIDESIKQKTTQFYLDIGQKAESDHGSVPKPTKDKREKNIPESQRSKDVGFGHKVKASEDASGEIHGIKFKNEDGTYIELTEAQKVEILNKDMAYELSLARKDSDGKQGWDSKLKKLGITWDDLDYKYQNALTSLAYNVGGIKAGTGWTKVLQAAKDGDVKEFAKQMRRKDSGSFTAGMDNRVAKELYYAGIISSLDEVSSVLPKADYKVAGIPKSGAA